jgi:hypothetical protein
MAAHFANSQSINSPHISAPLNRHRFTQCQQELKDMQPGRIPQRFENRRHLIDVSVQVNILRYFAE